MVELKKDFSRGQENAQDGLNENFTKLQEFIESFNKEGLLNIIHPIGSYYTSEDSTDPALLFGGTWLRVKGRVIVGVDESDSALKNASIQGGSINGLAEHSHVTKLSTYRVTANTGSGTSNNLGRATDMGNKMDGTFGSTETQGDNTNHNNWQPFVTAYMWKRTA